MFEAGVWTTPCSNPEFENSLSPRNSNPGFGNSMFEPGLWGTLCWNPGFWFSPSPRRVRTLGSPRTLCSIPGLGELFVGTPGSGTPRPPPPSGSSNSGFGNSMFRQTSKSSWVGGMLHHRSAKGLRRGGPQPPPVFLEACRYQRKRLLMTSPCHKRRSGHTKLLYGGFLRRNKRKRRQRKKLSMKSSSSQGGLRGL